MNKPKYMRPARDRAVKALVHIHGEKGEISSEDWEAQAQESGYSVRQLRRCVKAALGVDDSEDKTGWVVDDDVVSMVFLTCGNMALAYLQLEKQGVALPSERTFRRKVAATLGTQLVYAREGSDGYRDHQLYMRARYAHRLNSLLLDHTELPIWTIRRGYKQAVKPWITLVMDAKTRYPLSWVVTFGRPTSEEVRAALAQAMTTRLAPDGKTVVGGKPVRAVWDRGLEFLADVVTESCQRLGVVPVPLPAYSPHLKGRLERFWRFLKPSLAVLPGYAEGPRDVRGRSSLERHAVMEDTLLLHIADWMDNYITKHQVGDTRMTPLEMWQADGYPIEALAPERLWVDFLQGKPAKVSKNGIRFDTVDYSDPSGALHDKKGVTVEIRYLPHERGFIEVFYGGEHLCTAYPMGSLTAEEETDFSASRRAARAQARQRFSTANRLRTKPGSGAVRIEEDGRGRRWTIEPEEDDLLSGGEEAIIDVIGSWASDETQGRLF